MQSVKQISSKFTSLDLSQFFNYIDMYEFLVLKHRLQLCMNLEKTKKVSQTNWVN